MDIPPTKTVLQLLANLSAEMEQRWKKRNVMMETQKMETDVLLIESPKKIGFALEDQRHPQTFD